MPGLYLGEDNKVRDLVRKDEEVWVGTDAGLFRYDLLTSSYKEYHSDGKYGCLSSEQITELAVSDDGLILIGTITGLNIYNPFSDSFFCLNSTVNENGDKILSDDVVRSLLVCGSQIWVGSELEGITILSPKRLKIRNIHHRENDRSSLADTPVSAIHFSEDGRLWIGTMKNGLFLAEGPDARVFRNYDIRNSRLRHNMISCVVDGPAGTMWIADRDGILYRIDKRSGDTLVSLKTEPRLTNINDLLYDAHNDCLWVGTNSGLYRYDLSEQRLHRYPGADYPVYSSCTDRQGRLWFASQNGALCIDARTLRSASVTDKGTCFSVCIDSLDHLWLGSFGKGVFRSETPVAEIEGLSFRLLNMDSGLSDNRVRSMIASGNYVWVATENGLSRVDIRSDKVESFFLTDGLESMVFYRNATAVDAEGQLYFGHKKGFSVISSNEIRENKKRETILSFTECSFGEQIVNLSLETSVRLHEKDLPFSFSFADLSFDSSGKDYYYRLIPLDENWMKIPNTEKSGRYEYIPGGKYTLQIKTTDLTGETLGASQREIVIVPRFYKTWWFLVSCLLLAVLLVIFLFYFRTYSILRQKSKLKETVDAQTKLLKEKMDELLAQNRTLLHLNEELASKKMIINLGTTTAQKEEHADSFTDILMEKLRELYKNPDLNVDMLCRAVGMSRTVLNTKIQTSFGQSTTKFIRTYRLNLARELLNNNSGKNISELAYSVGFNDPKYFTRCFTKEFGFTPSSVLPKKTA